jgi:hypothetical protein
MMMHSQNKKFPSRTAIAAAVAHTAKPPAICETGGFALSPQTMCFANIVGVVGLATTERSSRRVRRAKNTPARARFQHPFLAMGPHRSAVRKAAPPSGI